MIITPFIRIDDSITARIEESIKYLLFNAKIILQEKDYNDFYNLICDAIDRTATATNRYKYTITKTTATIAVIVKEYSVVEGYEMLGRADISLGDLI